MPRATALRKKRKEGSSSLKSVVPAGSTHFDADIVQVICSFMNMEEYLRLQLVNTFFLKGVRQFCATIPYFRFTKHFFFLIQTAGQQKESNLIQFASQPPIIRSRYSNSCDIPKWTNSQLDPLFTASKALINKQLRGLLSTLYVHAKSVYFSDVPITKSLMNDLMFDTRHPSVIEKNKDNRLDFKFTETNVFETIEHISFVGCSFERGVLAFLASKLINLKSLLIFNSHELPFHEVYHLFNKKSKCKSLRLFYHDLIPIAEIIHQDQLNAHELEVLTNKGHTLGPTNKQRHHPSMSKQFSTSDQDVQDMIESIPDHVVAIPIVHTCAYHAVGSKVDNYESAIKEYMDLFGIFSNSFSDRELCVQLCGGKVHKRKGPVSLLAMMYGSASEKDEEETPPQLPINIDRMLSNVEFLLSNGLHLFDLPFDGYDFLRYSIYLHQNEPRLWNLYEKYHFRKLPDFNKLIIQPQLHEHVITLLQGIIDLSEQTLYPVQEANLIDFMEEVKEKKCYPRDLNDVMTNILEDLPDLIKPCVEKGLFNLRAPLPMARYYHPGADSEKAYEYLKEQHELENKKKKRKQ
ncbi:hypothetical protein C9374_012582 [Naegleria lovaniensis]|uniref:Uncharacterized protein n=1 Tax=Naegleria lovaniensis TaxID=51637 RepID=A0AA88GWP6_NAELO|nr:uncharacterized protein C9374_012582 [Naegleria lovaniensis]KAG2392330.1 hypothetical protein C9374_012582 [Naegleria lovaniensis]